MITISVANQKGGVGKTTTALCLADSLRRIQYKVLFLDLDPQTNSTSTYGAKIEGENTIFDLFKGECTIKEAIQHMDLGDIVPGDELLSTIEYEVMSKIGGFTVIKKALKQIEHEYDFCIIDTPPNLGIFMLNALSASNGCIIPLIGSKYAIDGLAKLISTINQVVENTNEDLKIYGALMTNYDVRTSLDKTTFAALPKVAEQFGFPYFKTPIRICQAVQDAQANNVSLFDYDPTCNAAVDYANVTKELLERIHQED